MMCFFLIGEDCHSFEPYLFKKVPESETGNIETLA